MCSGMAVAEYVNPPDAAEAESLERFMGCLLDSLHDVRAEMDIRFFLNSLGAVWIASLPPAAQPTPFVMLTCLPCSAHLCVPVCI